MPEDRQAQLRSKWRSGSGARHLTAALLPLLIACSPPQIVPATDPAAVATKATSAAAAQIQTPEPDTARRALFGDLHVHTRYSFDAFIFGTTASPDDAYRYAKGEAIRHPAGFTVQLRKPLDFYAVSDHAVYLGMLPAMADPKAPVASHPVAQQLIAAQTISARVAAFRGLRPRLNGSAGSDDLLDLSIVRSAWQAIQESAQRHNQPGQFTTFIAYEYTSAPEQQNLHRNVIFASDQAPELPFSRLDSNSPEALWSWMDDLRDQGIDSLAIPHNANASNGQMFAEHTFTGQPLTPGYAEQRLRNEPLVEISQVKGTSETHPLLSPNDEWAAFEIMPLRIASRRKSAVPGSYVREALGKGVALQAQRGFNPFQFGFVAGSDTHTGAASVHEDDFFSKAGLLDATPQRRGSVPLAPALTHQQTDSAPPSKDQNSAADGGQPAYADTYYNTWGAAGLTGVWAQENSRAAIYAAMRRKETFGTSGPRIALQLFAGFDLPAAPASAWADLGYRQGVPMGGDLLPVAATPGKDSDGAAAPQFIARALRDPDSAPLQRLQMVKGWVSAGQPQERVYDIACSDGLSVTGESHRCPDNGAQVNLESCSWSADRGAAELTARWQDPDFDPDQEAFYYLRVLENPSCRWSTWDALRAGVAPRSDLPATINERAWSSPIWYHGSVRQAATLAQNKPSF